MVSGSWLLFHCLEKVFNKVLWHPESESAILLSLLQTVALSGLTVDTMGYLSELLGSFKIYSRNRNITWDNRAYSVTAKTKLNYITGKDLVSCLKFCLRG